jgi:hypothetical protein
VFWRNVQSPSSGAKSRRGRRVLVWMGGQRRLIGAEGRVWKEEKEEGKP